jgi:hypothetical protein
LACVPLSLYTYLLMLFFKKKARFDSWKLNGFESKNDLQLVKDISFAINLIAKHSPWENVCRHQAYQAIVLCRWYKINSKVFIGFKKEEDNKISGHAWTVVNDTIITGFCNPDEYFIQTIYS